MSEFWNGRKLVLGCTIFVGYLCGYALRCDYVANPTSSPHQLTHVMSLEKEASLRVRLLVGKLRCEKNSLKASGKPFEIHSPCEVTVYCNYLD